MKRDRIRDISRCLALALLIAQFGAEIHLFSHALTDPAERMGTTKTCSTCLASSQLQNAVAPPTAEIPAHTIAWVSLVTEAAPPSFHVATFRTFRARAPPALV